MENLLTKRNLIIAGIVAAAVIGALLYFGSKGGNRETGGGLGGIFPSAAPTGAPAGAPGAPGQPAAGGAAGAENLPLSSETAKSLPVGTLVRLSLDNISSFAPVGTTSVRYHKNVPENLGHLFERRADGTDNEQRISNFTIPQITRVVWAPDGKRSIIFYNLDGQVRKLLVDYSTTTPKTNFLPDTISDIVFSPDSKSLAFINNLGDSQNIFTATSDFRSQRKIFDNNIPGFEISWPAENTIALKTKSSYAVRGFLYALNVQTGAFQKVAEGLGLDAVWNPNASGALYSTVNASGAMQNLKFIDIKSGGTKEFDIKTIAEKCAFLKTLKNVAFCAAPKNASGKLPDDWWKGKISFSDNFILVYAATGQTANYVPAPGDVTQPKLLGNDSFLLFREKTSGNLWSLKLKP